LVEIRKNKIIVSQRLLRYLSRKSIVKIFAEWNWRKFRENKKWDICYELISFWEFRCSNKRIKYIRFLINGTKWTINLWNISRDFSYQGYIQIRLIKVSEISHSLRIFISEFEAFSWLRIQLFITVKKMLS
jgi:hypothetical protein